MRNLFLTFLVFMGSLMLNAQCEIGNVTVTQLPCTNTGTFGVQINFDYANTSPNGFTITGGGWNHGNFLYTQLPVTINGLPGNGQNWEFVITDVANPNCANYALLSAVTCSTNACSVGSIVNSAWISPIINGAQTGECYCSVGIYEYNGAPVVYAPALAGVNSCADYASTVWNCTGEVIIQSGGLVTIGNLNDFLTNAVLLEPLVACSTNNTCSIYDLLAEAYCDGSTPVIDYQFAHTNTGTAGFDLFVNGNFHSTHAYGQIYYTQALPGIASGPISIAVTDHGNPNCTDTYTISLPSCTSPPACSIYDVTATATDCVNNQFYVTVHWMQANTSGTVNIHGNGMNYGNFPASAGAATLGPLSANSAVQLEFVVSDAQIDGCSDYAVINTPLCTAPACSIYDLTAEAVCEGAHAYVQYHFSYANPSSDTYVIYANTTPLATIPFNQVGEWIQLPDAMMGQTINFTVIANNNTACHDALSLAVPSCTTAGCSISGLVAEATACENGQYYLHINFSPANTSGTYNLLTSFGNFGPFSDADLPYLAGPFGSVAGTVLQFLVQDAQVSGCGASGYIIPPTCNNTGACSISNLTAAASCDGNAAYIHYTFSYANAGNAYYELFANDVLLTTIPFNQMGEWIMVPEQFEGQTINFTVAVNDNTACHQSMQVAIPHCPVNTNACSIYDVTATATECVNNQFYVTVHWMQANTSGTVNIHGNGMNYGNFPASAGAATLGPLSANSAAQLEFVVSDAQIDGCSDYAVINTPLCTAPACSIYDLTAEAVCEGAHAYVQYHFSYANPSSDTYVIYANTTPLATIPFSEMGQWIQLPDAMMGQTINFTVIANNNTACHDALSLTVPSCTTAGCSISNLTAAASCDGNAAYIHYTFGYANAGNAYYELFANDVLLTTIPFNQMGEWIMVPEQFEGQTINFTVAVNDNTACHQSMQVAIPHCPVNTNACSIYDVTATATDCVNNQFYVTVHWMQANTSGTVNIHGNGMNYGNFPASAGAATLGPLSANSAAQMEFVVSDAQIDGCSDHAVINTPLCTAPACSIYDLTAEAVCDGTNAYILYNFSHSNATNDFYELFINDHLLATIPYSEQTSTVLVPAAFLGQTVNFYVAENDNSGCHDVTSVVIPNCGGNTNCTISALSAEAVCDGAHAYVHYSFQVAGVATGNYALYANSVLLATIPFSQMGEWIQLPDAMMGQTINFMVIENNSTPCNNMVSLSVPNCTNNTACHIYDLWAEADCNSSTGIVTLHYGFHYANVPGTAFSIQVNNAQVGTHGYEGQDFVYTLELPQNLEGTTLILHINATGTSTCFDATEVNVPVCNINTGTDCWIEAVQAQASPCSENLFYVTIDFNYGQNNSEGFVIHGGPNNFNTIYGAYSYADLPVSIGPFEANGQAMVFGISDLATDGCDSPLITVLAPTCNNPTPCSISGLEASVVCDGPQAFINFSFDHAGTNPAGFDVMINNAFVSFMPYAAAGTLYHLLLPENVQGSSILFGVYDNDNPECHTAIEVAVPDCTPVSPCSITGLSATASACIDGHFFVTLDFNAANGSDHFTVQGNGMNYGTFSYANLPIQLGPFTGNTSGQMEFVVHDVAINSCSAEAVITVPQCNVINPCAISGLQTEINCDGPAAYLHFHFNVSGITGNNFSASINGANLGNFVYGLSNYTINLGNQYAGQTIQFTVSDNSADNCSQTVSLVVPNCTGEPVCDIYDLTATASDCENGQFYATIQFNHNNSGDLFHLTSGNGIDYGIYSYADLPVVIGPFQGNGTTVYGFEVSDIAHPGCGEFVILGTVSCGEPASCVINNLTASSLCVDGEVEVSFSFNYNGTVGNFFNVYLNNSFISELPFGQTSYTISVPGSNWQNAVLMVATQIAGYTCSDDVQVFIPNCSQVNDCSIFDLTATPLPCNSDGNYYVELNFEYINTGAQFQITNGENLTYGNFYYPALPVIVGPFHGDGSTAHVFEINDLTVAGCTASVTLPPVSCTAPVCEIGAITYTLSNCNATGNFSATIDFDHANTGNTGFNLYVEGELYGSYPFSALPVSIQGLSGNGLTIYDIAVEALTSDNCNAVTQIVAPDCGMNDCVITNLQVQVVDCTDGIITATVDFDAAYVGLNGFTLSSNMSIGGVYSYSSLPLTITWPETIGGFVEIQIADNGNSGCTATAVLEGLTCGSLVWPGDANSDGVANNFDLLALGLTYGYEGTQRVGASLVWEGQWCLNWDGQFMNGVYHKHADCDGNGFVSDADMQAINLNYGQVHGKGSSEADEFEAPLYVDIPSGSIPSGTMFEAPIVFGSSDIPAENVYGMAFTITYDPTIFADNTQSISFENSWLGHYNTEIKTLVKHFPENHQFEIAITRIGHTNIATGYGEVGTLRAILVENIEGKTNYDFQFVISDVRIISHDESDVPYSLPLETGTVQSSGIGGINDVNEVVIYPNPAQHHIILSGLDGAAAPVNIYNAAGSLVYSRQAISEGEVINLPDLAAGLYFTEVFTKTGPVRSKLYISRR